MVFSSKASTTFFIIVREWFFYHYCERRTSNYQGSRVRISGWIATQAVSVANVISKRFGEKCKFLKNVILRSNYYKYTQFKSPLAQMWFQGSSAKLFWCNSNKSAWERMQPKKDKEQQWEWWSPDSFGSRNNVIHCLAGEVRPRKSRQLGLSLTKSVWLNTLRDNLLMGRRNRDWNSNQPLSLSYHDLEFDWESRYLKLELPPILSYQDSGWSLPAWG